MRQRIHIILKLQKGHIHFVSATAAVLQRLHIVAVLYLAYT